MARISLKVNGKTQVVDVDPETPLLYVLRNDLQLNGPKFGCGLAQCGACTVIMNGNAIRSCVTAVSAAQIIRSPRSKAWGRPRRCTRSSRLSSTSRLCSAVTASTA